LRLYGWEPPALSLGKGQRASTSHDPGYLRDQGIDLVRRPTGGLAVLHEYERTYAVIAMLGREPFGAGVLDNYRRVARALAAAMRDLGADADAVSQTGPARQRQNDANGPACFNLASAHEIAVAGHKLIGSAQLRRRGAFLQHGSILIDGDPRRLSSALGAKAHAERFTDLRSALGRIPGDAQVDRCVIAAFQESFRAKLEPGGLTADELARASGLTRDKYGSDGWTFIR
jgi:lipoate-protein ligase A